MKITFERGLKCKYSGKDLYVKEIEIYDPRGAYHARVLFGVEMQEYTWAVYVSSGTMGYEIDQETVDQEGIPF